MAVFLGPDGQQLSAPKDVIAFLGKGEAHWRQGRSAFETAHSWFAANDIPPPVRKIIEQAPEFAAAILREAVFEKKTKLDSYGRESQTDVMAFLQVTNGSAVVGIEAKVDESFGQPVREWNDYGTNRVRRLAGLVDRLHFGSVPIGDLRYQLFHRVAAVLIEAEAVGARHAAMIVQSFDGKRAGFDDFSAFAAAFGTPVQALGQISPEKMLGDVSMRLGWTENPLHDGK